MVVCFPHVNVHHYIDSAKIMRLAPSPTHKDLVNTEKNIKKTWMVLCGLNPYFSQYVDGFANVDEIHKGWFCDILCGWT